MLIVALNKEDIQALSKLFESCPDQALTWAPLMDRDPLVWLVVDRQLGAWEVSANELLGMMEQARPGWAKNEDLFTAVMADMWGACQEHDRRHGRDQRLEVREPPPQILAMDAYQAYRSWAIATGRHPLGMKEFVTQLNGFQGIRHFKAKTGRFRDRHVFEGLVLSKDAAIFLNETR